jgi:hypothetical protein
MAITKKSLVSKGSSKKSTKKSSPKAPAISSAKLATAFKSSMRASRIVY